jgi:hypothetical protein
MELQVGPYLVTIGPPRKSGIEVKCIKKGKLVESLEINLVSAQLMDCQKL